MFLSNNRLSVVQFFSHCTSIFLTLQQMVAARNKRDASNLSRKRSNHVFGSLLNAMYVVKDDFFWAGISFPVSSSLCFDSGNQIG